MSLIEQAMERMDGRRPRRRKGSVVNGRKVRAEVVDAVETAHASNGIDGANGAVTDEAKNAYDGIAGLYQKSGLAPDTDDSTQTSDDQPSIEPAPRSKRDASAQPADDDTLIGEFVIPDAKPASGTKPNGRNVNADGMSIEDASGAIVLSRSASVELQLNDIGGQAYLNPRATRTPVMDAFRRIKRPLLANAFGQGLPAVDRGQRILVTSSVPAEGKTFTSVHLALSIAAELDTSVILVDADIVKPSVLKMLGVEPRPGIADWFQYPRPTAPELVLTTNVEGFRLVPAGAWKPNSVEVLASRAIGGFFDQLSAAFPNDIIVVDSPPVLAANETTSLASHMGQIVFVVGSGTTSQNEVQQSLELLEGEQVVSLMLNRSSKNTVLGHYGY